MQSFTQVLLVNFGEKEAAYSLKVLKALQENGLKAELYPDSAKMKKQMKYADQKGIQYVMLIGEEEMKTGNITLKDMGSGEQQTAGISEIIAKLQNN
jgi:histidyl-tRNA synthetase